MRMRLRTLLVGIGAVVVGAVVVVAVTASSGGQTRPGTVRVITGDPAPAVLDGEWPTTAPPPQHPTSFTVADAIVPQVPLFSSPGVPLEGGRVLDNPTWEGLDVLFLVKGVSDEWLGVQVSSRPNGMRAFVRAADVKLRTVPNWIRVDLSDRVSRVLHGDDVIWQTKVAIGAPSTPTPLGMYFVDGTVFLNDDGGPYGAAQLSVSAFSEVHYQFGGGVGQLALHGTNAPGLLGQAVSNGCIRMTNEAILKLATMAPNGTPVEFVP